MTLQKERDLELAARIGQSLLKQNQELTARNEMLDEQLEIAKEEVETNPMMHSHYTARFVLLQSADLKWIHFLDCSTSS